MAEDKNSDTNSENDERTTISVKGVSKDIYDRMSRIARETGRTIGEVTNDAYRVFIGTFEGALGISREFIKGAKSTHVYVVSNIKKLEMSGEDIKELGGRVSFRNIESLTFKDISQEDFDSRVDSILQVRKLTLPHGIKKSSVVVKCDFVDNIVFEE